MVPGTQHDVDFMVKDSKRFADSGGWGYAEFEYDAASDMFRPGTLDDQPPQANDAKCGFRVPHGSAEKRLRFHGVRAPVNSEQDCHRPPDASATTGIDLTYLEIG